MILAASWSSEQSAASPTGAEVVAVATGGETLAADPILLPLIVVGKGVGFEVAVGIRGISVGAGCVGHGVRVGGAVGLGGAGVLVGVGAGVGVDGTGVNVAMGSEVGVSVG